VTAPSLQGTPPAVGGAAASPSALRIIAGVIGIGVLGVLCWSAVQSRLGTGEPVATDRVDLLLNDFNPDAIAVPQGATVTWHFDGEVTHDIVGQGWGTSARAAGSFAHTFTEPGAYDYRCTIHGPMRGTVVVK
jgi:plastocyanin